MLASMFSRLRELPAEMLQMLQSVLLGLPFTFLCQTSPSACNTYKQMQNIANFDLRAIQRDCQQMVSRSMAQGVAARDDAQGLCFREGLAAGEDPENLWERCSMGPSLLPGPNGAQGATISVLDEVLGRTGLPPERQGRIRAVFGDLVLSVGDGGVSTERRVPGDFGVRRYSEALEASSLGCRTRCASGAGRGRSAPPSGWRAIPCRATPCATSPLNPTPRSALCASSAWLQRWPCKPRYMNSLPRRRI